MAKRAVGGGQTLGGGEVKDYEIIVLDERTGEVRNLFLDYDPEEHILSGQALKFLITQELGHGDYEII